MVISGILTAHSARRCMLVMLTTVTGSGCGDASFATSSNPEPFVYLILSPGPLPVPGAPSDSAIRALLLTVGSSSGAMFRHAERFQLARSRDASLFNVAERSPAPGVPAFEGREINQADGNYVVPVSPAQGLGALDIRPLESYDLTIETSGRIVTGVVVVPAEPAPRMVVLAGVRTVVFPPVAGAVAYLVSADTERWPPRLVTDTVVQLRYDREPMFVPPSPEFRIVALDSNFYRYVSDTTVATAGLTGALGVFAGASSARLSLPQP